MMLNLSVFIFIFYKGYYEKIRERRGKLYRKSELKQRQRKKDKPIVPWKFQSGRRANLFRPGTGEGGKVTGYTGRFYDKMKIVGGGGVDIGYSWTHTYRISNLKMSKHWL